MVEVIGTVHRVEVRVAEDVNRDEVIKEKVKELMEIQEQIERLQKVAKGIRNELKELVTDTMKVQVPEIGVVKISWKVQNREKIDRKKMKELVPAQLLEQFVRKEEIKVFEVRKVKE